MFERAPELFDSRSAAALDARAETLQTHCKPLTSGRMDTDPGVGEALPSNITPEEHASMVNRAMEYIRAGDIFQVVIGQRFARRSAADPFDVYRALRAVNPSLPSEALCRQSGLATIPGGFREVHPQPSDGLPRRQ